MKKNKIIVFIAGALSVGVVGLLTGCSSQKNPLKVVNPTIAAQFLVNASQAAEKSLHIFQAPGGEYYGLCMTGKVKQALCKKLYQAMAQYAKTTSRFKGVTVAELTNSVVFTQLQSIYQRIQFDTV